MEVFSWYRQASQADDSRVNSQKGKGPQSPDPPAFPDLAEAGIMSVYMFA